MLEYVDTDTYKAEILSQERKRIRQVQRRLAEQKKERKRQARISKLRRIGGIFIIVVSLALACSGLFYDKITGIGDCTWVALAVLFGLLIALEGFGSWLVFVLGRIFGWICRIFQ